jgi:hypothetical protein
VTATSGDATTCLGDAGGPALRENGAGKCLDQDYTGGRPHPTVNAWQCWNPATANQRWILN